MHRVLVLLVLTLGLPLAAAATPIDFASDTLTYTPAKEIVTLTGNVSVKQGATTLNSGQLTINMAKGKPTRMVATGGATFTRTGADALTATGSTATYVPGDDALTLSGNVTLTRAGNTLRGENLTYDLKSGNAKLTGGGNRVHGTFTPQE